MTASNERVLNEAGLYYFLMNAVLLFGACCTALAYVSVSIEVMRIARNISFLPNASTITDKQFSEIFQYYSTCYITAKFLILLYAVLFWFWTLSDIGHNANLAVAIIALAFVAIVIVPFPRLYLEHKWWLLCDKDGSQYHDIRSHRTRIIST